MKSFKFLYEQLHIFRDKYINKSITELDDTSSSNDSITLDNDIATLSKHFMNSLEDLLSLWKKEAEVSYLSVPGIGKRVVIGVNPGDNLWDETNIHNSINAFNSGDQIVRSKSQHTAEVSINKSSIKGFFMSDECTWDEMDHIADRYLSGRIVDICWQQPNRSSTQQQAANGDRKISTSAPSLDLAGKWGPWAEIILDCLPLDHRYKTMTVPLCNVIPFENIEDDASNLALGHHLLLLIPNSSGVFEPVHITEVEHLQLDLSSSSYVFGNEKKYSVLFKNNRKTSSQPHQISSYQCTLVKLGHLWSYNFWPIHALSYIGQSLAPFFEISQLQTSQQRESGSISAVVALINAKWRRALYLSFQKNQGALSSLINFVYDKIVNHCENYELWLKDDIANLVDSMAPTVLYSSHTFDIGFWCRKDKVSWGKHNLEQLRTCQDSFRMLDGVYNILLGFAMFLKSESSVTATEENDTGGVDPEERLSEDRKLPDIKENGSDSDFNGDGISMQNRDSRHTTQIFAPGNLSALLPNVTTNSIFSDGTDKHEMKRTSSAVFGTNAALSYCKPIQLLSKAAEESTQKLLSRLSPPFVIPTRDWCFVMYEILNNRNALVCVMAKVALLETSVVEALFLQRVADVHELIPVRLHEALAHCAYVFEASILDSVTREEWDSNQQYRRGKKVTTGVVALGLSYRGFIFDVMNILGPHRVFARRLCVGIIGTAVRAFLNVYQALETSRVRAVQLRQDVTAFVRTLILTLQTLQSKDILPQDDASISDFPPLMHSAWLLETQRAAFKHYYNAFGNSNQQVIWTPDEINFTILDELPPTLDGMYVEDYGFGDINCSFLISFEDDLVELLLFSFLQTCPLTTIRDLLQNFRLTQQSNIPISTDFALSPDLLAQLCCPMVTLRRDELAGQQIATVSRLLSLAKVSEDQFDKSPKHGLHLDYQYQKSKFDDGSDSLSYSSSFMYTHADQKQASATIADDHTDIASASITQQSTKTLYNPMEDISTCCGGHAEPYLELDAEYETEGLSHKDGFKSSTPLRQVYAMVSKDILNLVYVRHEWFEDVISKRPELRSDVFPALNEQETALKNEIVALFEVVDRKCGDDMVMYW